MNRRKFLHGLMTPFIAAGATSGATTFTAALSLGQPASDVPPGKASAPNRWIGVSRSVWTGFPDLDGCLGELRDGMPVAIAGRPSMGKTSLALAAAAHIAIQLRRPVTIFSAPLNEQEVRARVISFLARVDLWWDRWKLKSLPTGPARVAMQALASAPLLIDDRPFLSTEDLASKVMWNNVQAGLRNGLTVILAPELIQVAGKWRRHLPKGAALIEALRDLGETYGGAVLCELPLGRAAEERDNHWPLLTDLEGISREFARDADAVLLLYRPVIYDLNAEPEAASVIVARNRSGRCGGTSLAFEYNGGFANYRWPVGEKSL